VAYKSDNLQQIFPRMGSGDNVALDDGGYAVGLWSYRQITADDALATMVADDYITDGNDKGVKPGDIIAFVETAVDAQWMTVDTVDADGLVAVTSFSNP
jgi:hypothetical protein